MLNLEKEIREFTGYRCSVFGGSVEVCGVGELSGDNMCIKINSSV